MKYPKFVIILKTPLNNILAFDLEVTVKVQGMLWCSALTEKQPGFIASAIT